MNTGKSAKSVLAKRRVKSPFEEDLIQTCDALIEHSVGYLTFATLGEMEKLLNRHPMATWRSATMQEALASHIQRAVDATHLRLTKELRKIEISVPPAHDD